MLAVILRALKDKKFSLILFCAAGIFFLIMYVALFPAIQKQSAQLTKVLESYPQGVLKAFNMEDLNFSTLEKFLAAEQYSFTWPLLVIFLAVSFSGSLVRDIERGTIDFALTRPISRFRLYAGRVLASLSAVYLFVLASILLAVPIAAVFGVPIIARNHMIMTMAGLLFGTAIVGIASFFGAWFSERGKAYAATGGVVLTMYVFNIIANLKENLSWLHYLSLFHYFDATAALAHGQLSLGSGAVLVGVALVTLAGGALIFQRRDLTAVG
jgi:ABC-2 type transport system permease protein